MHQGIILTMKKPSVFSHTDWLDWLLAIGFTALLTFIGWLLQEKFGWIVGLVVAPVLLWMAKSKRDQANHAVDESEPAQEEEPPAK